MDPLAKCENPYTRWMSKSGGSPPDPLKTPWIPSGSPMDPLLDPLFKEAFRRTIYMPVLQQTPCLCHLVNVTNGHRHSRRAHSRVMGACLSRCKHKSHVSGVTQARKLCVWRRSARRRLTTNPRLSVLPTSCIAGQKPFCSTTRHWSVACLYSTSTK